jgi:hypothetical protein
MCKIYKVPLRTFALFHVDGSVQHNSSNLMVVMFKYNLKTCVIKNVDLQCIFVNLHKFITYFITKRNFVTLRITNVKKKNKTICNQLCFNITA